MSINHPYRAGSPHRKRPLDARRTREVVSIRARTLSSLLTLGFAQQLNRRFDSSLPLVMRAVRRSPNQTATRVGRSGGGRASAGGPVMEVHANSLAPELHSLDSEP